MGVRWRDGVPHLSFNVRDMANATVRHELDSGLPRTMVTTIYAYRENGGRPIAASALSCRVTKDLLENNYRVQVESASTDRTARLATLDDVIERCLVVRNRGVGSADDYTRFGGQRIFFAVLVAFQPVSREEVQRIRRL